VTYRLRPKPSCAPSSKHGYAVDDSDVYDRVAAERHYAALAKLYRETLHA
jgi:hypothetical protein